MQSGGISSILHIALRGEKMKIGVFIGDICHSYQQIVIKALKEYTKEKNNYINYIKYLTSLKKE